LRRLPVDLSVEALADLAEIRAYYRKVAGRSVSARIVTRIRKALASIERMPQAGSPRQDLGDHVRLHVAGAYVIYADVSAAKVVILRILHAARNRDAIMGRDPD
jgi:plasmid stabilization system protein ParE